MAAVTLISDPQAKEGGSFYYMGPQPECGDCKLKNVCLNLEHGSKYEITSVRGQTHDCAVNEDKVRVVEIKKVAQISAIPKKSAIEGSVITFQEPECGRWDCTNHRACHSPGMENGRKYSVVGTEGSAECPAGHDLILARLF